MRAYLLPSSQYNRGLDLGRFEVNHRDSKLLDNHPHSCFANAKTGIRYLLEKYNLQREDEVWITTTSDSPFVSSCVTCTVFNHCKVSRVFTRKTKMIWVIHEFGFPHPNLDKIIAMGKEQGIPVVEDSAHALHSVREGKSLGFSADYGLFSLPKIFPVDSGGILVGDKGSVNNTFYDEKIDIAVNDKLRRWLPYVKGFAEQRRKNYQYLRNQFASYPEVYEFSAELSPFVYGFKTPLAGELYRQLDHANSSIEFARTYNQDWVLLPVNALLGEPDLSNMCNELLECIEKEAQND